MVKPAAVQELRPSLACLLDDPAIRRAERPIVNLLRHMPSDIPLSETAAALACMETVEDGSLSHHEASKRLPQLVGKLVRKGFQLEPDVVEGVLTYLWREPSPTSLITKNTGNVRVSPPWIPRAESTSIDDFVRRFLLTHQGQALSAIDAHRVFLANSGARTLLPQLEEEFNCRVQRLVAEKLAVDVKPNNVRYVYVRPSEIPPAAMPGRALGRILVRNALEVICENNCRISHADFVQGLSGRIGNRRIPSENMVRIITALQEHVARSGLQLNNEVSSYIPGYDTSRLVLRLNPELTQLKSSDAAKAHPTQTRRRMSGSG